MSGPPFPGERTLSGSGTSEADLDATELTARELRDAALLQTPWLRSFLAVADQGGFGAATTVLSLSQSRVSAHIAALERALGVTLFDRKARPIRTTGAGERFRGYAVNALLELQRGVESARSTLDDVVAHVSIGSYPCVSSTYLPSVLRELTSHHPGITIELREGTASTLETMLASGTIDLAFLPVLPHMRGARLCHRTIWREDVVAVMREDAPLARRATVGISDLRNLPLIGMPGGGEEEGGGFDLRNTLGDAVKRADIAYLTDQPATLVALVRSAFGIGVINRLALQNATAEGLAVRTIDSPTARRDVALFWPRRRAGDAVVRAFLDAQERAQLPPCVRAVPGRPAPPAIPTVRGGSPELAAR